MHLQTCMQWRLEHLCTVLLHMLKQKQRWQRMSFLQCGQCWGSLASLPRPGNRSWQKYHVCCGCHSIMLCGHCRISVLNACMSRQICIGVFLGDSRGESAFGVFEFCASYLTTLFSSLLTCTGWALCSVTECAIKNEQRIVMSMHRMEAIELRVLRVTHVLHD